MRYTTKVPAALTQNRPALSAQIVGTARHQRGMALVMALVMLLILTLLGISAMSTSSLEERMAGNIQEQVRAFQAAESGVNSILKETGAMNPNTPQTRNYSYDSEKSGKATVTSTWKEYTQPDRTGIADAHGLAGAQYAHFDVVSSGTTNTNAKSVHHQGIRLTIPPAQN